MTERGVNVPQFAFDCTTPRLGLWRKVLQPFAGQPNVQAMEIGCLEGRSTLWFLDNVLQHESSGIICIEPDCRQSFVDNIAPYRHKVRLFEAYSAVALKDPKLTSSVLSFIYIDGDHRAANVLEDAVLSFPLLVPGGILIFDDYLWRSSTPHVPQSMPRLAIEAFLSVYDGQYKLLYRGYQVVIQKNWGMLAVRRD